MEPISLLLGLSLIASLVGTGVSAIGAAQQSEASKRAEQLRERQMNLEDRRQKQKNYRELLKGRAAALVGATAQGASSGSGLAGGYGQIGGTAATNFTGINKGTEIGAGIFDANMAATDAGTMVAFGQGLSSLGQQLGSVKLG